MSASDPRASFEGQPTVRPELVEGRRVAISRRTRGALAVLAFVGAFTAAVGAVVAPDRMWANWLLVSYFAVGLSLSGLCFVAIHYTTGSSWSVAIRRVPEALAGLMPVALIVLGVALAIRPQLYPWTSGDVGPGEESALAFKRFWLNRPFFLMRAGTYAVIWMLFAHAIRRRSRRQDDDGDPRWTDANRRVSAAFLVVFAVTFSLASFDWVMSLEPGWYSTIFAVYNFAGLFLAGLAACIVLAVWLERAGPLQGVLNEEHLHDLGKLLFAFSTFWMYIWFSQYMLIWYANIPEETIYFIPRVRGAWYPLFLLNIVLNWVVPFLVLLRRDTKRRRDVLVPVAVAVLVGRWLDLYLMIMPPAVGSRGPASAGPSLGPAAVGSWGPALAGPLPSPSIGVWEIGLLAGGVGLAGLALARVLRAAPIVPVGDPQLEESLQYEH